MTEPLTNKPDQDDTEIAKKLQEVAERTQAPSYFVVELEQRLREKHIPKGSWHWQWRDLTPTLGWMVLVLAIGIPLIWGIRNFIPTPQPASDGTSTALEPTASPTVTVVSDDNVTPAPETHGYDWRNAKLYLSVPLPGSPVGTNLYVPQEEQPATIETARALATQFGIAGNIYETSQGLFNATGYLVTDGRQRLYMQSNLHYDYYSDYGAYTYTSGDKNITDQQAAIAIETFMKSHGLDLPYQIQSARRDPGMYFVLPLTPDGFTIWHDYNIPARLEFTIDQNQQVIRVTSYQVGYEAFGGTYGIRTAEEAFQQVLDQSHTIHNGVLESIRSAGLSQAGFWSRTYPDNQTITIIGQPATYPASNKDTLPFASIGQWTVIGNVTGLKNVDPTTYVEATGQFVTENGIRKFNVDSWKVTSAEEFYLSGTLRREGDQTILTVEDGSAEYTIEDAPEDLPLKTTLPDEYLTIYGFMNEGKLDWYSIQYYPSGSGGGGGGGSGNGFYQLNLSGTPVPFPIEQSTQGNTEYIVSENDTLSSIAENFGVTLDQLVAANNLPDADHVLTGQRLIIPGLQQNQPVIGQHIKVERGIFSMTTYRKTDGSQRVEYALYLNPELYPFLYAILEGSNLEDLQGYHNRPVDIWGTIESVDPNGTPIVNVERYEIPFPNLDFQLMEGTQRMTQLNGQQITLFTASEGITYAQITSIGIPDSTILGLEGNDVILEVLAVPGETFGGYPALRVFSGETVNPMENQSTELTITANQPHVMDEAPGMEEYTPTSATIEKVELVYYGPDPLYGNQNGNADGTPQYIQPAWRFYGHYSNGDEFEFLVQALKQEFLLPELAPYRRPG